MAVLRQKAQPAAAAPRPRPGELFARHRAGPCALDGENESTALVCGPRLSQTTTVSDRLGRGGRSHPRGFFNRTSHAGIPAADLLWVPELRAKSNEAIPCSACLQESARPSRSRVPRIPGHPRPKPIDAGASRVPCAPDVPSNRHSWARGYRPIRGYNRGRVGHLPSVRGLGGLEGRPVDRPLSLACTESGSCHCQNGLEHPR